MRKSIHFYLIGFILLTALSACSYVKSWFPDKTRDYLDTGSIPPLKIPKDLGGDYYTGLDSAETAVPTAEPRDSKNQMPVTDNSSVTQSEPPSSPDINAKSIVVELKKTSDGIDSLHIGAPLSTAWNMVNKAISRQSIEVTERNQTDAVFTIQYELQPKKAQDKNIWDEVAFMFKGNQANDREYRVKLVETDQQTDVTVLDNDNKPAPKDIALKLLTDLQQSIKASLAK
jgi:outer membrane protein assembly factor BamC